MNPELDELKKMTQEMREEIHALRNDVIAIRRRLFFGALWSYIKLALLLIPIALGLLWFQPQIKMLSETWQQFTQSVESLQNSQLLR